MDLVFIYLSITMFIFVLVLTVSSLLPPTGLTLALACDPHSVWALPLLQEMLWGWRARKDVLWGVCSWAEVALWDLTLSQGQGLGPWDLKPHKHQS